ncbi:hypothetical protein [Aeromonas media]|uniref:hypothetical protein n=1 Tax=Aeromonas media TaxID=651 RepID=UPI001269EA1E|nr:hypothetical protein [Aeromonas media]
MIGNTLESSSLGQPMELIFSLLVLVAVPMVVWSRLRSRHIAFTVLASYVLICIAGKVGVDRVCFDGWNSSSIGKQGACSHHGGVTSELTEFGYLVLVVCGLFLLVKWWRWKTKQDQAAAAAQAAAIAAAPSPNYRPAREQPPFIPKPPSLHDYDVFIGGWLQQGLSPSEIVAHLNSRGVVVTTAEIQKYASNSSRTPISQSRPTTASSRQREKRT